MIRDIVILKLKDKRLAAFSVFIPMVAGDSAMASEEPAKGLRKAGIASYWDGDRKLGSAYAKAFKNPFGIRIAWDVYFLYGPDAVWGEAPPLPGFFMHQMKEDDPRCLDPERFREETKKLLSKLPKGK